MTEPGFQIEGVQYGVPFRSRTTYAGFQVFGDQENVVLVDPVIAVALRAAAAEASPNETGGLLSGRLLRDNGGRYVLVAGFVEAPVGSGRAAAFDVSPQATAHMREEAAHSHPTADVVGWWHSHLGPSHYSETDLASQSIWRQPHSVGLLVFAAGEPWATIYLGPDARHLGYPASPLRSQTGRPGLKHMPSGSRGDADSQAGPPTVPAAADPGTKLARPWSPRSPQRLERLLRLTTIILVFFAILLLAVGYAISTQLTNGRQAISRQLNSGQHALSRQLATGQAQLSSQLRQALAPRSGLSISSACTPMPPSATVGAYRCTARASGARGTIDWRLDGKPSGTGPSIVIQVPLDGRAHRILALLQTATGAYPGPAEDIPPQVGRAGRGTVPAGGHSAG